MGKRRPKTSVKRPTDLERVYVFGPSFKEFRKFMSEAGAEPNPQGCKKGTYQFMYLQNAHQAMGLRGQKALMLAGFETRADIKEFSILVPRFNFYGWDQLFPEASNELPRN